MGELITKAPLELSADNFCGLCGRQVVRADNFCRNCGHAVQELAIVNDEFPLAVVAPPVGGHPNTLAPLPPVEPVQYVLNNRALVVGFVILFGPFGLPVLWFSPQFSKPVKILTTTIFVLFTIVMPLAIAWYWMDYSLRPMLEVLNR